MPQKFVSKRIPKTDYPRLGALGLSTILKELIRQHHNSRSLAGKPLAGFCATRSRRIQDLLAWWCM